MDREKNSPSPTLTVRQVFKQDSAILEKVTGIMPEQGLAPRDSKAKTKLLNQIFEDA